MKDKKDADLEKRKGKRPYEKPRIDSESVYERGALGCGKMLAQPIFDCITDPNAS